MGSGFASWKKGFEPQGLAIHAARWVVPVDGPVLENAGVAVFENRIVEVASADELRTRYLGRFRDHGDSILCPGLVNAHCHLELSPLRWRLSPSGSFFHWVRALVRARDRIAPHEWEKAVDQATRELLRNGTVAVGDVGNLPVVPEIAKKGWPFRGIHFHEVIAPREDHSLSLPGVNVLEPASGFKKALSAHAPYSVAPSHLRAIKELDRRMGLPFSIHVAESREEILFFSRGTGPLRDFLEEKGHWPLDYPLPSTTPVRYLHSLGILDQDTLCVHCVHLGEDEKDLLAGTGAQVCLCPRSNVFLGVGKPDMSALLKRGINVALGTDSLASNDRLSIFAEMNSLAAICPDVRPEEIFRAATLGGARALGLGGSIGSLSRGKKADILIVRSGPLKRSELHEFLVKSWADGPPDCSFVDATSPEEDLIAALQDIQRRT